MKGQTNPPDHAASTAELRANLEHVLSEFSSAPCRLIDISRRPSQYHSSYPLEELDVQLEDGRELSLVFKDLSYQSLPDTVRRIKPDFLHDPLREIDAYRYILAGRGLGTATCYGTVVDRSIDRYWLFLERVSGRELYKVGEFTLWQQAARWLANLHSGFASHLEWLALRPHLIRHDDQYYWRWMRRAEAFLSTTDGTLQVDPHSVRDLPRDYARVVQRLAALPMTLIHGEFYASNVLVQGEREHARICPIDWEMAAIGPGLIDLAALTSGSWSNFEQESLARAYHDELRRNCATALSFAELWEALDYCRLHLAIQWLGWSVDWTPPREHRHDWRNEALTLKLRLGLN